MSITGLLFSLLVVSLSTAHGGAAITKQPLNPGGEDISSSGSTTVPAFPVAQAQSNQSCHLDLSDELFGGVAEACGNLDRSRCCPVLAAWLFAAHARSALQVRPPPFAGGEFSGDELGSEMPMAPDDSQKCVDSLQSSLHSRNIVLPRPNSSCDAVLCFCGIRLHQISSLSCPAAFNISGGGGGGGVAATPTAAVRKLEKSCRNSSYSGCTRCLESLDLLRGGAAADERDRASRMFGRDCQLMGLTWLLARNKTAFIPTVSAVIRAILYSSHHSTGGAAKLTKYRCSPDQENMPLAVDSLRFERREKGAAPGQPSGRAAVVVFAVIFFLIWKG